MDLVLVLDMSTSMLRETAAGNVKRDVVLQAAKDFVLLLAMEPAPGTNRRDRVAVVWFNDLAGIEQPLTGDRAAALAAIDRLPGRSAQGTRLDLAFLQGAAAVPPAIRLPDNIPVMIMLTDGLPNRVPFPPGGRQEDTVLAAANQAKAEGIQIYTIGVGRPDAPNIVDRVDPVLLGACASDPSMFFLAPEAEDLAEIYRQIAREFCAIPSVSRPHHVYLPIFHWTNDPDGRRVFPSSGP